MRHEVRGCALRSHQPFVPALSTGALLGIMVLVGVWGHIKDERDRVKAEEEEREEAEITKRLTIKKDEVEDVEQLEVILII
jgi:hypothetical protein